MNELNFSTSKDTFGFKSLKSFLTHVDSYQCVRNIHDKTQIIKFNFVDNGIPVFDIFEFFTNNNIKFGDTNIIVVETLRQFLSMVWRLDKNKKYVVLSESYWDQSKHQIDLSYELIYIPWDIIDFQNKLTNRSNLYFHLIDLDCLKKHQPKWDFLCLIGRSKSWRDLFVDKLKHNIDLSNSLTSYYGVSIGNCSLLDIDIPFDRTNSKLEFEEKFYKPINIPDTNLNYNLSYFTKNELFYSTKFSVVVETESELEEYHVTEKTLKCLVLGHPFVVLATPGYLNYLRSIGFTTYNEIFDESYDTILDLDDRMDGLIKQIENLQNFVFDVDKLREIQQKNLLNLFQIRNNYVEKFLNIFNDRLI